MARPTKHQFRYKYVGRTSKLTPEVVTKLEEASAVRSSIKEACFYAGISKQTYFRWMKENPELSDRLEDLRQKPFLHARRTIISRLDDVNVAFKFLEKEKPDEYGERLNMQHSVEIAQGGALHPEDDALRIEFRERLRANIRKRWENKEQQAQQQSA